MEGLEGVLACLGGVLEALGGILLFDVPLLEAPGGFLEALEGVLKVLGGVLEAMLSQDRAKKAQECEIIEETKGHSIVWHPMGASWRHLGRVLGSS